MTPQEFKSAVLTGWVDENGLVISELNSKGSNSGNGILYTCVFSVLLNLVGLKLETLQALIEKCYYKPGCLERNEQNTFGQEEFDDYLGVAAACISCGETEIPRAILKYGIGHLFFFNNEEAFSWDSFLGRSPQVWVLMWCAAFPWLKWPMFPLLWLVGQFQTLDASNGGGVQLGWLYFNACKQLGFTFKQYATAIQMLPAAFIQYYQVGHPFIGEI